MDLYWRGCIRRRGRNLWGSGQNCFQHLTLLHSNLKILTHFFHTGPLPFGLCSAEIITNSDQARAARFEPKPGSGIIFPPGGDLVTTFDSQVFKLSVMPPPWGSWKNPDRAALA